MRFLLLACLALAAAPLAAQGSPASASTGGLQGRVVSRDSVPVPDAVISVAGRTARTDRAGFFSMRDLPAGTHQLEARRIGFQPVTRSVTIRAGSLELTRLVLNEVSHRLEAMRTVAEYMRDDGRLWMLRDFERRRARGTGVFLSREEMQYFYSIGSAVASRTPGVREVRDQFGNWSFVFTRCRQSGLGAGSVAVYVDGMRASGGQDVLSFYRPNDIEAIEIYRSVAELPPEAVGDGCAAVFIWLRRT
jgi:hypothetical protein